MTYPANTTLITLSRPFKLDGAEVETIQMREPTVFDKLAFEKNKGAALEKEVTMIAGLCGLNPGDLYQLPAYDYEQLTTAFNDFLLPPAERSNLSS
ncbi:phage tail assembly protein [Kluyvera intermedia]|uniref:phage tail assembly protein n=1 Tax=Kluyvera intermedia TaxID=61648 RepID=UPI0035253D16